jgi:hypothetical protein
MVIAIMGKIISFRASRDDTVMARVAALCYGVDGSVVESTINNECLDIMAYNAIEACYRMDIRLSPRAITMAP